MSVVAEPATPEEIVQMLLEGTASLDDFCEYPRYHHEDWFIVMATALVRARRRPNPELAEAILHRLQLLRPGDPITLKVCRCCGSDNLQTARFCGWCSHDTFIAKGMPRLEESIRCPHCHGETRYHPKVAVYCDLCGKRINPDGTAG